MRGVVAMFKDGMMIRMGLGSRLGRSRLERGILPPHPDLNTAIIYIFLLFL